jgi:hypothetical protein
LYRVFKKSFSKIEVNISIGENVVYPKALSIWPEFGLLSRGKVKESGQELEKAKWLENKDDVGVWSSSSRRRS